MPYLDYPDRKILVLNGIDNPVPTLTDTISVSACQFFMTRGSRVFSECVDTMENLLETFLGYCTEIFLDGFFKIDPIFGHRASVS